MQPFSCIFLLLLITHASKLDLSISFWVLLRLRVVAQRVFLFFGRSCFSLYIIPYCSVSFCFLIQHFVQGFSTGLPERLQLPLLRTLPGLENCSMLRPAYAVEYDFLPAHQCRRSLMTKKIDGLFFSGQINGTTGYEEAAAQVCILMSLV